MASIQPTGAHACDTVILSSLFSSNEHQTHPTLDPKAHQKREVATNCHNGILSVAMRTRSCSKVMSTGGLSTQQKETDPKGHTHDGACQSIILALGRGGQGSKARTEYTVSLRPTWDTCNLAF